MNKFIATAAVIAFACGCNNTARPPVDALKNNLLGVWEQDSKEFANGRYFRTGYQDSVRKDTSGGYKLNFRESYATDDNMPTGEKLQFTVRPDSVIVLAGRFHLKIIKLTKDSLVYRRLIDGSDELHRLSGGYIFRSHRVE